MSSSEHFTIDLLHLSPMVEGKCLYEQYNFHSFLFFSVERRNFEVVQKVYIYNYIKDNIWHIHSLSTDKNVLTVR